MLRYLRGEDDPLAEEEEKILGVGFVGGFVFEAFKVWEGKGGEDLPASVAHRGRNAECIGDVDLAVSE